MQYSKDQLIGLSRDELVRIGHEFGVRATGLQTIDLVYEILDRSATAAAAGATDAPKPVRRGRPKKSENTDKPAAPEVVKPTAKPTKAAKQKLTAGADFQPLALEQLGTTTGAPKPTEPPAVKATKKAPAAPAIAKKKAATEDFIILQDVPTEGNTLSNPVVQPHVTNGREAVNPHPYGVSEPANMSTGNAQPSKPAAKQKAAKHTAHAVAYNFGDLITVSGLLETVDNYGFLRSADYNYLPSPDDIYISPQQIKQYGLRMGDVVEGPVQPPLPSEHYFTLRSVTRINGLEPKQVRDRVAFEFLTPIFPNEKFTLLSNDKSDSESSRIVDLFTPIGKGQRALIVAQPKTGKTLLMKDIANSIAKHHPEAYLIMLLIDERPEEVTDMARTVNAEVVASTFDAPADNHVKIATLVIEKAKRMVECGHDVVIFLDSITRLARAYNTIAPGSGKILSGGVDALSLQKPKRFFGAARNIENGGSLTIIATALIDTGSKMDEVIFEEFKGTGNMELQLDRTLANKRIFPAVNLVASSTRRDELLLPELVSKRMWIVRKHIADMTSLEAMDLMKGMMEKTDNNSELLISINS